MKKYLVISYTTYPDGNIAEEWLMDESDDRNEAVKEAIHWADRADKHHPVELRQVTEIIDTDDDGEPVNYDYDIIDYREENKTIELLDRAKMFNMKAVCERANVSYGSWRLFACGKQGLSNKAYEAIVRVMDNT